MFTALELRIAFYILCGLIIALTTTVIVRRRWRAKRLTQQPQPAVVAKATSVDQPPAATVGSEALPPVTGGASLIESRSDVSANEISRNALASGLRGPEPDENAFQPRDVTPSRSSLTFEHSGGQDRKLFASQIPHGWLRDDTIPKLEPHDVPSADASDYAFGPATPTLAAFFPETDKARLTLIQELKQSGDYAPHARENLAATRFVFMFGALLIGGLCVVFAPAALELPLLIGMLVMTALGWALPALFVKGKAESRRTEIERSIPDMMDVLNMCVSQGLTVSEALHRVARDLKPVYPALAQEMSIVVDQARIGTLREALQNFAERFDLPKVQSFVSLMTQSEYLGTSISAALTEYADNMRESLRQRADERANHASFSLLFPSVLCLMPAVFLFLMGPAVIELSKFNQTGGMSALSEGRDTARNLNRQQAGGNSPSSRINRR